jgi:hypothetical protein
MGSLGNDRLDRDGNPKNSDFVEDILSIVLRTGELCDLGKSVHQGKFMIGQVHRQFINGSQTAEKLTVYGKVHG